MIQSRGFEDLKVTVSPSPLSRPSLVVPNNLLFAEQFPLPPPKGPNPDSTVCRIHILREIEWKTLTLSLEIERLKQRAAPYDLRL